MRVLGTNLLKNRISQIVWAWARFFRVAGSGVLYPKRVSDQNAGAKCIRQLNSLQGYGHCLENIMFRYCVAPLFAASC